MSLGRALAWSALAYGAHVSDVLALLGRRVVQAKVERGPELGWWDHEAAALDEGYNDQETYRPHKLVEPSTMRPIENVTRLENFGSPDVHWSRVTVDPARPELFGFSPAIVAANVAEHPPPR